MITVRLHSGRCNRYPLCEDEWGEECRVRCDGDPATGEPCDNTVRFELDGENHRGQLETRRCCCQHLKAHWAELRNREAA